MNQTKWNSDPLGRPVALALRIASALWLALAIMGSAWPSWAGSGRPSLDRQVERSLIRSDAIHARVLDAHLLTQHREIGLQPVVLGAQPRALEGTVDAPAPRVRQDVVRNADGGADRRSDERRPTLRQRHGHGRRIAARHAQERRMTACAMELTTVSPDGAAPRALHEYAPRPPADPASPPAPQRARRATPSGQACDPAARPARAAADGSRHPPPR